MTTSEPAARPMQTRSEPAPPAFRLRRYFSITSGVAILLVTIVITFAYRWSELGDHVEMAELRNVILAQTFANTIWPQFSSHLMRSYGDAKQIQESPDTVRLHKTLALMSRHVPVIKVKIYNAAGIAVYSSVPQEIGENKSANPAFAAARAGKIVSELTHRGQMSVSEGVIENVDVVSSYIPISLDGSSEKAVFELYTDITEFVARVKATTWRLMAALILVFAVLYGVLLLIVGHADRILQSQYHKLTDNEDQIRAKNRELESEVAERRLVEAALRKSEEEAAAANHAKSEFLSRMSHELRTPMNAILGFTQLLGIEPNAPLSSAQGEFVEQILKAGRHLLNLINEVLDITRIEAGKMSLSVEPVSVSNVLSECLPLIQNMARQNDVSITLPSQTDRTHVKADYIRLKQVLLNLLSNAVKYNRIGGHVLVAVKPADGGRIRISVADTGTGIPDARKDELFQPFSRLGTQLAEVEGTGIGLALSKHLMIAMNGEIGYTSVPGSGSTFWIELSSAPDREAPLPVAVAESAPAEPAPQATSGRKILYIEDNPANMLLMEKIVKRTSARFIDAHNAELGIKLALLEKPDLILMDINLPGMDGYQALAELRRRPETAAIPVIALTAHAMAKDIERGLAAGFYRYETKPIQVEKMIDMIRTILERKT